mgnify:CR=1 FL=1
MAEDTNVEVEALKKAISDGTIDSQDPENVTPATTPAATTAPTETPAN